MRVRSLFIALISAALILPLSAQEFELPRGIEFGESIKTFEGQIMPINYSWNVFTDEEHGDISIHAGVKDTAWYNDTIVLEIRAYFYNDRLFGATFLLSDTTPVVDYIKNTYEWFVGDVGFVYFDNDLYKMYDLHNMSRIMFFNTELHREYLNHIREVDSGG